MITILTTGPPGKQNISNEKKYENRNTCAKVIGKQRKLREKKQFKEKKIHIVELYNFSFFEVG